MGFHAEGQFSYGWVRAGFSFDDSKGPQLDDLSNAGNWELAADIGTSISDLEASDARPGTAFAGSDGDGIWSSTDIGETWQRFDEGLDSSEPKIFDLELSSCGDRLYAGTLGGMGVRMLH